MRMFSSVLGLRVRKCLGSFLSFDIIGTLVLTFHRPVVYSAVADLVHHIRNELTTTQVARVVHVYSRIIHNPALGNSLHTMSVKMMFGLTEPIITKETPQGAARLLGAMFETCLQRLEVLALIYDDVTARAGLLKENSEAVVLDAAFIEKTRPVGGAIYAIEKPEDIIHGISSAVHF